MNKVIDLLKSHRSIRKFKQEPISNEKVLTIIEAAGIAATSNFIQAYSVIRVTNKKNRKQIAELLKIPNHVYPIFGLCLGYPDEKPEQKPRLPVNVILKEDYYQDAQTDLIRYNKTCSDYYQNRSSGSREDTWTRQISER